MHFYPECSLPVGEADEKQRFLRAERLDRARASVYEAQLRAQS